MKVNVVKINIHVFKVVHLSFCVEMETQTVGPLKI